VVQGPDGQVSAAVTPDTEIEFDHSGHGSHDSSHSWDHSEDEATVADLKPGAGVAELELEHGVLEEIELQRTAAI
jgi:hypothetical protein